VTGLAAARSAYAVALAPPYCAGGRAATPERIEVRSFRGTTLATLRARRGRTIDGVAIAGRFVAWLLHTTSATGAQATRATLVIYDLARRRERLRRSLDIAGAEGPPAVRLAIEPDGRAALLLPAADSAPCPAGPRLAWISPAHPRLHRIAAAVAPASPLARGPGGAGIVGPRTDAGRGCPEAGSIAAVRLAGGGTTTLATLASDELATGALAWDGSRAAFAAIEPQKDADGTFTYRTSVRLAAG
jgi:hypothetical protein